jgi:hypothetical protein
MADKLGRSFFFRGFRKTLVAQLGEAAAREIWDEAGGVLAQLQKQYQDLDSDSRMMILPAAALLGVLRKHVPEDALELLTAHGRTMGEKIARIVHGITSIPGLPELLWNHMPKLMRTMSGPDKGYTRRIVSETRELVGVDILSCPLHNAAVKIGMPEAALVVCAMDKAYMTGFRHIEYTRTTSVAEGADCCDYRLRYDKTKS